MEEGGRRKVRGVSKQSAGLFDFNFCVSRGEMQPRTATVSACACASRGDDDRVRSTRRVARGDIYASSGRRWGFIGTVAKAE